MEVDHGPFTVSPDRKRLAFTRPIHEGRIEAVVTDLLGGKIQVIPSKVLDISEFPSKNSIWGYVTFSPDSQQLLIHIRSRRSTGISYFDLRSNRSLAEFNSTQWCMGEFFDTDGRPKIIQAEFPLLLNTWEIWDLETNLKTFKIVPSKTMKESAADLKLPQPVLRNADDLMAYCEGTKVIDLASLKDDSVVRTIKTPFTAYWLLLSQDARYLLYSYERSSKFLPLLREYSTALDQWLESLDPPPWHLGLVDLQSDGEYSNLPGNSSGPFGFSEDGKSFYTYTDQGRFDFDLPPKWQTCTPWAWLVSTAWICLFLLWIRLRRRSAPIPTVPLN